jgi:hypothetical protein
LDDYEEEEEPFLSETEEQLAAAEVPETQAAHQSVVNLTVIEHTS